MIDELNGDFLQRLRGFFYVAKTGSFSAASREMRRNQSTISYQVRQLEESLNADLFLRTGRGATLTPQGRQLFNMVLDIFDKIEDIQRCMLGKNREASGPVYFAVSPLALHGVLIPLLPKLRAAFPAVRFTIQQVRGWDDSVHRDITSRVLDFAVVPADGVLTGLRFTPFYRSQTVLCAPRDMPLAQDIHLNIAELAQLPHIVPKATKGIRGRAEELMRKQGLTLNVAQVVGNMYLQAAMVDSGFGVALMDEQSVTTIQGTMRLKTVSLDNLFPPRVYGILQTPQAEPSAQARQVMDFFLRNGNFQPHTAEAD